MVTGVCVCMCVCMGIIGRDLGKYAAIPLHPIVYREQTDRHTNKTPNSTQGFHCRFAAIFMVMERYAHISG